MNLTDNLSDAFNYSLKLTRNIGNLIILIILNIIPIVNFIVLGYAARIFKEGPEEPPMVERYGEAFIDGLKIMVAGFIYALVPIIIFAIIVGAAIISMPAIWMGRLGEMETSLVIFSLIWSAIPILLVLGFLFAIVGLMGIMHMLATGKFGKAFAFSEIFGLIGRIGWGNYIVWLLVIYVLGIIVSSMSNVPWVGWVLSAILTVFFEVFVARSARNIYPWAHLQETGAYGMPSLLA